MIIAEGLGFGDNYPKNINLFYVVYNKLFGPRKVFNGSLTFFNNSNF